MAAEEVKLLGFWVSPVSHRIEWALKIKGVEYEYVEEDIFHKSSLLLDLNPVYKKVPVLVHNGNAISESFVILEYVDEAWKQNPLLPQDPYERALTRFWAKFAEEKLLRTAWNALCSRGEAKQKGVQESKEALEKIEEEQLKGKQFFGGERLGFLDIILGWIPYLLPVWEEVGSMEILDSDKFPAITAWIHRFLNHPAIKNSLPPRDKMVVYFQKRSQEFASRAK